MEVVVAPVAELVPPLLTRPSSKSLLVPKNIDNALEAERTSEPVSVFPNTIQEHDDDEDSEEEVKSPSAPMLSVPAPASGAPPSLAAPARPSARPPSKNFLAMGLEIGQTNRWVNLWDKSWTRHQLPPFDMGECCPELTRILEVLKSGPTEDEIELKDVPFPSDSGAGKAVNVLVPGCGSGYDLIEFAKYGYKVTGVDISKVATERAESLIKRKCKCFGL
jgi:hypothetical protein